MINRRAVVREDDTLAPFAETRLPAAPEPPPIAAMNGAISDERFTTVEDDAPRLG